MADNNHNDNVQHGIDDNPNNDAGKGAALGGIGGAIVGGLAGGPLGAVIGAVAGAAASGVGVAAVDQIDNDNTVSGLGDGVTPDTSSVNTNNYATPTSGGLTTLRTDGDVAPATLRTDEYDTTGANPMNYNNKVTADTNLPRVNRAEYDRLSDDDKTRVQLVEEQLHVNKEERQAGEVEISKRIVSEQV